MAESETITREALERAKFRGPMQFSDGHKGMARQDYECVSEPRFGYAWRREEYGDKGRTFYTVDGCEVPDLDEAVRVLAQPADPESPREQMQRIFRDPESRRAYLLAAKASHHASGGAFSPVVAAMERSGHPWHVGINRFQDAERAAGRECQPWLYDANNAAHEAGRLMILWRRDREQDTGLRCVLDQACRTCTVLNTIETAMVESRTPREGAILPGYDVWDTDIDMAKTWTCITHILRTPSVTYTGEGLLHTAADREHAEAESQHLARISDALEEEFNG